MSHHGMIELECYSIYVNCIVIIYTFDQSVPIRWS
jgi:hypothetical protein